MFDDANDGDSELDKVLGDAMRRPLAETIAHLDKELTSRWPTVENLVQEAHDLRTTVGALARKVDGSAETLERYSDAENDRQQHIDKVLSGVAGWIASAASSMRDLQTDRTAQEDAVTDLLVRMHDRTDGLRRLVVVLSCVVTVQLAACVMVVAGALMR